MANVSSARVIGCRQLIGLAVALLCLGAAVYVVARNPGSAAAIPFAGAGRHLGLSFGPVAGWLPDLLHPLAFALLTAATGQATRRTAVSACLLWWVIDTVAELLQHPSALDWLARVALHGRVIEPLISFGRHGTFDPADLAAIAAGALLAGAVLRFWIDEESSHAH